MTPELKAKWIAALESGEHKKGKHVLHNSSDNTKCCLGVLCVIEGIEPDNQYDSQGRHFYSGSMFYLSPSLQTKFGIPDDLQRELSDLNDVHKTWNEVIEYIKDNL